MDINLEEYNRKRDFNISPEPQGIKDKRADKLRFVVQRHLARRDHYDFRLEWKGTLLSWAVPKGPSYDVSEKRLAIKVEDHPLEYRNFEGTIPKGEYGGGTVMLWDEGYWEPNGDTYKGLIDGALKFSLNGIRLKGKWTLVQIKEDKDNKDNWLLIKEKDEYSKDDNGIEEYNTSVRSGRTMEDIERGIDKILATNPFQTTPIQLALLVTTPPKDDNWIYELKYDGYRIIAYIENNSARLMSRNNQDYTERFRKVANSLIHLSNGRAMVLDGEMTVCSEDGRTDFQALQNYMKDSRKGSLIYFIFDVLALDGEDMRIKPLLARKDKLMQLLEKSPDNLHYSRHMRGKGEECYKAACEMGMEGIIGKHVDSTYSGGRSGDWIKIKCGNRQEFVIGGYTRTNKKINGISSLILGVYDRGELIYKGRVGTGFSERESEELEIMLSSIKRTESPYKKSPKRRANEEIFWVEPIYSAEVSYIGLSEDKLLRQASFKGLRKDKRPQEIVLEREQDVMIDNAEKNSINPQDVMRNIRITNPDRIVFAAEGIKKLDVINYYAAVGDRMLPYISGRLLSIVRCPKGIKEACFYKKHPGAGSKGIITVPDSSGNDREDYFYIEDALGLINEAQMGTLEFHTWASKAEQLESPDIMVFDLDPDEGMGIDRVRQGARDLKTVLDELSLKSYIKTSGGKGYHIVLPFAPSCSWEQFYEFARKLAEVMVERWSDKYTNNVRKAERKGKIFIDWMRNGRGATSIAPYSLRAREGAKVSMPIAWSELDMMAPDGVDLAIALERIKDKDPWEGFIYNNQRINCNNRQ